MVTRYLIACVAFLLSSGVIAAPQESGNDLLQQALVKERAEGNLKEAIQIYQQIVEKHRANRPLAAKALLQMGQCYERLGYADARRTYERLLREYWDQGDVAAEARTRLAALAATETKPKFTKIRVPTGLPRRSAFALSPDGQQLAYVSGGSVWLVPVHGKTDPAIAGAPRQITQPMKSWSGITDVTWSRDGNWLALHVWEPSSDGNPYPVYMVRSTGGEPRQVPLELKSRVQGFGDSRLSLSPDGKRLAYAMWREGESPGGRSVYLAPTDGGPPTRLTQPLTSDPVFSPDGKRIAYLGLVGDPDWGPGRERGRQIWVKPVDGGSPVLVYELPPPGRIRRPTWSPDGTKLAVLVNRENRTGDCNEILVVPVGPGGRPSASPARLSLPYETGARLAGWSPGDQIGLILRTPDETAIYTVPSSGGKAVQLTPSWANMPSWTPDGKRICFAGDHFDRFAKIECVPSQGGKMARIPFRVRGPNPLELSYPGTDISVSPDGKRILFMGSYRGSAKRVPSLFTVPVEGGDVAEIVTGVNPATNPCWSPDGESIAFVGWEEAGNNKYTHNVYTVPAEGGQARKLTSQSDEVAFAGIAWSPDGGQIAFYSEDQKVKLVPAGGGPARVLVEALTGNRRISLRLAWSPNGKDLLYTTKARIWKLNLGTGKSVEVQTGMEATHTQMAWSPDGKTIAFSASQGGETELWLMEDFLPDSGGGE